MTRTLTTFFLLLLLTAVPAASQQLATDVTVTPVLEGFTPASTPEWGGDVAVTTSEPIGRPSAAGRANGVGYIAVPDTGIVQNRYLVLYRTTNFGASWTRHSTAGPPVFLISRTKMVKLANDSIYCFFHRTDGRLYYWNVETSTIRMFDSTNIEHFDVATSSTGGLYLFTDPTDTTRIYRYGSSNGGVTWGSRGTVTSAGAVPRIFMNNQAVDSLTLTYYGPVQPDISRSIIRLFRYRETAPGVLAIAGSSSDVDLDTAFARTEHAAYKIGNIVWFFAAKGTTGAIDITCRVSTDAGATFGAPFLAAGNPNVDEYWFEATNYTILGGGLDFFYYADSLGSTVNNTTDRLFYGFLTRTSPEGVQGLTQVSQHPPAWSPRNYKPSSFEFYDGDGDVGVVWVGLDGSQRKVYFDRYNAPATSVKGSGELPQVYALEQNYPNPFNPSTVIEFSVPKSGEVTLKVYDLLGREVRSLVSGVVEAGVHRARLDARGMASGVYLYQLRAGQFVATRKLTVLK